MSAAATVLPVRRLNQFERVRRTIAQRGYSIRYEAGIACPGCQHRAFLVGRSSAECARCGTALPLAHGAD